MTMPPWFYLSYARRDDIGAHVVRKFWEMLAEVVAQKAGVPSEVPLKQVGFLDQSTIGPGEHWEPQIAEALRTCRTLVCLLSPSYLESEYCGKEVQVFRDRLKEHGAASPLIQLILWDRPDKVRSMLPPALSRLQILPYERVGDLVRRGRHMKCVLDLAERLVTVAEEFPLPATGRIRELREVTSAFHGGGPKRGDAIERRGSPQFRNVGPSNGVVSPEDLKNAPERLTDEVFAIEVLRRPVALSRDDRGNVTVTIDRHDVREMLISNEAKWLITQQCVTPRNRAALLEKDLAVHHFLAEGRGREELIDLEDLETCLRWASGGILSIVTDKSGKRWVPLFFRDIRPYGWNIALGTTERWFTKSSGYRLPDSAYTLEGDLIDPRTFILREFLEESLIVTGIPRQGGTLYYKSFRFPHDDSPIAEKRAKQFYEEHCALRIEDELTIVARQGHEAEVAFLKPKCSVNVLYGEGEPVKTPDVLVCFSLLDLGIEVVRVAEYQLAEGDWMLDGEVKEIYRSGMESAKRELIRMPTALVALSYLKKMFGDGQDWQQYTFGPQPSIRAARPPDPNRGEIVLWDWDVRRRLQAIAGEWDARSMKNRFVDWYDKFRDYIIVDPEHLKKEWQLVDDAKVFQLFVPGTAKALNLYFNMLGREDAK